MAGVFTKTGYEIKRKPVKLSDLSIMAIMVAFVIVAVASGYLFCRSYPMDWQEKAVSQNRNVLSIKQDLLELGFPEYVLDDLTDEDDDKEYYDDEIKGADQIQDDEEEEEERRPSPLEFDDED